MPQLSPSHIPTRLAILFALFVPATFVHCTSYLHCKEIQFHFRMRTHTAKSQCSLRSLPFLFPNPMIVPLNQSVPTIPVVASTVALIRGTCPDRKQDINLFSIFVWTCMLPILA
ncbi:hypothetical protein DFJ77DRAFT_57811 [Powellomyces hirtus]|nr:hypothetical protein DFJ77DRAFT_57811 [Powellomyces hirtus]